MNTLAELKSKIQKSSHINEIENLISLRAFLFNQEECPWAILEDLNSLNRIVEEFSTKDSSFYKNRNIKNIKKINIDLNYISNMPKNKRLVLINILDDIIENLLFGRLLIIDKLRIDPFSKDEFFEYLESNKEYFDKEYYDIYKKRNNDIKNLLEYADYKKHIYDTCSSLTIKFKIKHYWKKIWLDKTAYSKTENTSVENILI